MKKRLHMRVYGLVQGVFFRAYTRDKAQSLGLTGFVRNLPDGSVEIVAEGEEDLLKVLEHWCKTEGSPASKVERVESEWQPAKNEFTSFEIRY